MWRKGPDWAMWKHPCHLSYYADFVSDLVLCPMQWFSDVQSRYLEHNEEVSSPVDGIHMFYKGSR